MPEVAIPLSIAVALAIMGGGWIALRLAHTLPTVIAFSGGIVVAVALLEVLPEAIENIGDAHDAVPLVAIGFLTFFLLERVLVLHHRDEPDEARSHERVGVLGALGLSLHTFTDGVGIGLAFSVNAETGFLVFLAVVSHGFADGLNTVSFVLSQDGDRRRALRWLRIDAIAPVAGAIVGSAISVSDQTLGYFLALYAGFFLYMGATDLLPEAHAHEHDGHGSWRRVALTIAGFAAIYAITLVGHPH
ncbi:MAG TPA: ZIP family metal transporter [Solirubrobacterales bacterium]|jgi:ZIP family zinc transporter|nr:ZIP family metal transporter [Solirubrobacterales bacterium]